MAVVYRTPKLNPSQPVSYIPPELDSRLGSGLQLPLSLVNNTYRVRKGIEKIRQDIWMALCTPIGRRWGQPDYGSDLLRFVHEIYTEKLRIEMIEETERVIRTWIPQIILESVTIDETDLNTNQVGIDIKFVVKGTASFQTFTMPITLEEGMKIPASFFHVNGVPSLPRISITNASTLVP